MIIDASFIGVGLFILGMLCGIVATSPYKHQEKKK